MSKTWLLVVMIFLLMPLLFAGCGVPQEDYDALLAERDAAQTEAASLQSDLTKVQSDLAAAQNRSKTLGSDLSVAQEQIKTLQGDYNAQEAKIAKATAYAWVYHIFLYPMREVAGIPHKLPFKSNAEWLVELTKYVEATEDDILLSNLRTIEKGGTEADLAASYLLHNTAIAILRALEWVNVTTTPLPQPHPAILTYENSAL